MGNQELHVNVIEEVAESILAGDPPLGFGMKLV